MKKLLSLIFALLLTLTTLFGTTGCDLFSPSEDQEPVNNKSVILFIGDGMGENHVTNAITYFELDNPNFTNDLKYYSDTSSLSSGATDSAAGATAIASGTRVYNSAIATLNGANVKTITEHAIKAGKKVGVVTTDYLHGATPAGFSAHADDRKHTMTIINSQATSGVSLFIGYSDKTSDVADSYCTTYADTFTANGYQLANSYEDMRAKCDTDKLLTTIPKLRSEYGAGKNGHIQLKDLVSFAIEYLDNENGFFLMVEGAYIDKYSHSNSLVNTLAETRSFFDAIDVGYAYSDKNANCAIVITADHETGGLQLATSKDEITNDLYTSEDHTKTTVPVYIRNFEYFKADTIINNTEVFTICKTALGL